MMATNPPAANDQAGAPTTTANIPPHKHNTASCIAMTLYTGGR